VPACLGCSGEKLLNGCYYFAAGGVQSIVMNTVCLSVHSHNSNTTQPSFTIFLCMLPVAVVQSSSDTLYTSGFIDDVTFSYHEASGPELITMLCLEAVRQVAVSVGL